MSNSTFPPRPPLSDRDSNSSMRPHEQDYSEPLLPYAFRHGQANPTSFYPAGPTGAAGTPGASWVHVLGSGRGRFRLVVLAAGACLLFLLHAHFYRPRHHGPPPFWQPPPPPPFDHHAPPSPPEQYDNHVLEPAIVHEKFPPIPPPSTFTPESTSPIAELPLLPQKLVVQPRRPTPPTSPNPWPSLPATWGGHHWLAESRFPRDDPYSAGAMSDPPLLSPPPAKYLLKAFEWAVREKKAIMERFNAVAAPGTGWDSRTGRPTIVERDQIKLGGDGWKKPSLKVADIEQGKGVGALKKVQYDGDVPHGHEEEAERREWVKRAFLHVWEGYKKHAWGHDELKPLTNGSSDNYNGWGATIVDTLDTLLIMDLSHEYNLAREHIATIDFTYLVAKAPFSTGLPDLEDFKVVDTPEPEPEPPVADVPDLTERQMGRFQPNAGQLLTSPTTIPTFETTIRYLGGLLSAYDLSGDPLMLARAKELGDWILPAMGTKFGLAMCRYTIGSNPAGGPSGRSVLSEVGSLTMEFTRLSMLTGDETYFLAVQRGMDTLDTGFTSAAASSDKTKRARLGTLLPAYVDAAFPDNTAGEYTFGGLADSYYEYLIKQYQLMGGVSQQFGRMYGDAIDSAHKYLIRPIDVVPGRTGLTTIGAMTWGTWSSKLEHLTCFAGGMLGLGSKLLGREYDMGAALNVTEACAWAYESSETGVGPESMTFYEPNDPSRYYIVDSPDGLGKARKPRGNPMGIRHSDAKYIGRPETIESVFYMWRMTGDRKWQDRGWQMFTSWVEHAINEVGFATISNVNFITTRREDSMESFVLAETLKYYYLLFSPPELISLDDWVFNTEAHPFRVPKPSSQQVTKSYLWTGPDDTALPPPSFDSNVGQGTPVQLWARVQQAATLNAIKNKAASRKSQPVSDTRPKFVRPPKAQLQEAIAQNEAAKLAAAEQLAAAAPGHGTKNIEPVVHLGGGGFARPG